MIDRVPLFLQDELRDVLGSTWWRENQLEPNEELDQFTRRESRHRFHCRANGCHRMFSRRDRAIDHFREHIDHRPFGCNKLCGDSSWYALIAFVLSGSDSLSSSLAFLSHRDLQSHVKRPLQECARWLVKVFSYARRLISFFAADALSRRGISTVISNQGDVDTLQGSNSHQDFQTISFLVFIAAC